MLPKKINKALKIDNYFRKFAKSGHTALKSIWNFKILPLGVL